jgi:hypothetical protein
MSNNKAFKVKNGLELQEYAKSISDTAVDIFVYDTRKDSDGGAWRKRTQHTSWYNETLNTSTRGSRKEFPAVAVIVSDSVADTITIYDGDDPDLPMWMVFDQGATGMLGRYMVQNSDFDHFVFMLNGVLATGYNNEGTNYGSPIINFISEKVVRMDQQAGGSEAGIWVGSIADRNSNDAGYAVSDEDYQIVNGAVNDIAMTVLPNAPIDAATGLPVPTIAVATDGGVSVIKDDGTVVDSSLTVGISSVSFTENNALVYNRTDLPGSAGDPVQVQLTIPTADGFTADQVFSSTTAPASNKWNNPDVVGTSDADFVVGSGANNIGFNYISNKVNDKTSGMTVQVTSEFNSGWQNGDIKLATLSDTDDTNVTRTNLATSYTGGTGGTVTTSGSQITVTQTSGTNGRAVSNTFSTTLGKKYMLEATAHSNSGTTSYRMEVRGPELVLSNFTGTKQITFNGTGGNIYVELYNMGAVGTSSTYDNVTVTEVEADRSVNGEQGSHGKALQVFGTVTKSAVATDADLVAYSGFSGSNYLEQPYNSDLDFGTGDFCIVGWNKGTDTAGYLIARNDGSGSTDRIAVDVSSGKYRFYLEAGATGILTSTSDADTNTWTQFCALRRSGTTELYINGKLEASGTSTIDLDNSSCVLHIGDVPHVGNGYYGSLALFRISATAPSPEQIKKIYEDEKVLFQDGAQATLYGSSDAVTALAYDDSTNLLHVGTSAGRSVFQGLRRVDNTTDAVGAAISASNGLVADE